MNQNYHVFTRGYVRKTYEECLKHVVSYAESLDEKEAIFIPRIQQVTGNVFGNVFNAMRRLSFIYEAKASQNLLIDNQPDEFRKHAYLAGKLGLMGCNDIGWWYPEFCIFMCDNEELIHYMLQYEQSNYRPDLFTSFLASDWDSLELALKHQVDHPPVKSSSQVKKEIHEIYIRFTQAVLKQDLSSMSACLQRLLEKRFLRSDIYADGMLFTFYLKIYVLILAKIAMRHGWDLGIDHPCAPKELIEIRPLPAYNDPYDFMHELDYQRPHAEWVTLWQNRMNAKEEQDAALKARYSGMKGIFNRLKDKFKDRT